MGIFKAILCCGLAFLLGKTPVFAQPPAGEDLTLWYNIDAQDTFTNALPIGNGYMGGMIYGGVAKDVIGLNESTVWSGNPGNNNKQGAANSLAQARSQIFAGDYAGADATVGNMIGGGQASFQPVGNLYLEFPGHNGTGYYRELNLKTAIAKTTYTYSGVVYTREYFASYPDKVIVVRITANQAGKITFTASMDSPLTPTSTSTAGSNTLILNGQADAIKFQNRLKVTTDGGTASIANNKISVSGANSATIVLAIGTNFNSYNDVSGDQAARATTTINNLGTKTYEAILAAHLKDYQTLFNRVQLDLNSSVDASKTTTDKRVSNFASNDDPNLVRLHYQFGRYLLISSSRAGSQPANLQGVWNRDLYPSWGSKYTTNINLEMNYWMVETANLAECARPLIDKVKNLVPQGQLTAKTHWGVNEGWVLHHNTDLWNRTGPIDGAWGHWPSGAAWLSTHLWEHYQFNPDLTYLAEVYPTMKGAAQFFLNSLVEEPVSGKKYLVTSPSSSPELQHGAYWTCFAPTMDIQIVRDIFNITIKTAQLLGTDDLLRTQIDAAVKRLPPHQIGKYKQLQEWFQDWDSPTNTHRHVSHLYGLFPSNQITVAGTPDLIAAAKTTLTQRGDQATGWSLAWKINFWARLEDGNHAYTLIKMLLTPERTYKNLFDAHPPFQIDGNFGAVSGVNEMLVQSQNNEIQILPALPSKWPGGSIRGVMARGKFEIDSLAWAGGKLTHISIISHNGGTMNVRYGTVKQTVVTTKGESYLFDANLNPINVVKDPVPIPGKVEAENYSSMTGIQVETDTEGNTNVGWINSGDISKYLLQAQSAGTYVMRFRLATGAADNSLISVKDSTGKVLGTLTVDASKSDGWSNWYTDSTSFALGAGKQTLTLEFTGTSEFLCNLDWFELSSIPVSFIYSEELGKSYALDRIPNPNQLGFVVNAPVGEVVSLRLYSPKGTLVHEQSRKGQGKILIPETAGIKKGAYFVVLFSEKQGKVVRSTYITF